MAKSVEELIILKRTALKYILARESKLLSVGKRPVNKKIANFVRKHEQESTVWSNFMDSLNEDLTRNINVYELKLGESDGNRNKQRTFRLNSDSKEFLMHYRMPVCGGRMEEAPIVQTEQGRLQGRVATTPSGRNYYSFQGVPYARPPLGSLRFKAPQPPEPWDDIRDASSEGNICAQINHFNDSQYLGDENCLFLNVYTPNLDGEFLPVMVYIHGGGFKFGSGSASMYGADYLVEKDVIVVTMNYRCGVLGFLSLNTPEVPGNAGLKDIVQAIRWVKENIHNFGGNSGNITLFGESAGGAAVSMFTASPLTKNLISKAVIQSGTALNGFAFQKNPLKNAKNIANLLGCDAEDVDDILEYLSTTPVKDLVEANEKLHPIEILMEGSNVFAPVVEKEFPDVEAVLTEAFIDLLTSGRITDIPIMIGSTTLEFTFEQTSDDLQAYIPEDLKIARNTEESLAIAEKIKQLYFKGNHTGVESLNELFELVSDKLVNIDTHRYVQYLVKVTNKPIYYYKFDYVGELNLTQKLLKNLGLKHAGHMDELGYLFKNDHQNDVKPTPEDIKMRERMLALWTNFAKCGNPTPEENEYLTVTWLPVNREHLYYLNLSNELSLGTNPDKEKMQFWDDLYSKHFKIWEHPNLNTEEAPRKELEREIIQEVVVEAVAEAVNNDEPEQEIPTETLQEAITEIVMESVPELIEHHKGVVLDEKEEVFDVKEEVLDVKEEVSDVKEEVSDLKEEVSDVKEEVLDVKEEVLDVKEEVLNVKDVSEATDEVKPLQEKVKACKEEVKTYINGNGVEKKTSVSRTSNEIKMAQQSNGDPKDVIRANDPPEDDLPKNIGVNRFVNFFNSLGGKK